jgi:RNA polymerase sigma factor (sigma-70 family)
MDPITQEAVLLSAEPSTSFEEFFRSEFERLFQVLYLSTGSRVEAEELAQEAMARAYARWDRVGLMASPAGYVYRTAFNLNRRRLRRESFRPRRWLGSVAPSDPDEASEHRSEVVAIVSTLPRDLREALLLTEWLDLDTDEAARLLGIKAVSVRGRVHRAKKLLRERFGENDE